MKLVNDEITHGEWGNDVYDRMMNAISYDLLSLTNYFDDDRDIHISEALEVVMEEDYEYRRQDV